MPSSLVMTKMNLLHVGAAFLCEVGSESRLTRFSPDAFPLPKSPFQTGLLASVEVKQNYSLDSNEEVRRSGPGKIKRREVVLGPEVSPEKIKSREVELGLKAGLLLLQLFPNGGAADIDFVTIPHSSWDSSCEVQ